MRDEGWPYLFIPHPLSIVENASSPVDSKGASRRGIGRVAGVWKSLDCQQASGSSGGVLDYPRTFVFACDFSSCGPEDPIARLWRGFSLTSLLAGAISLQKGCLGRGVSVIVAERPSGHCGPCIRAPITDSSLLSFTVVSKAVLFVLERRGSKETQEGALFKMQDTAEKKDHQEDKASSPVKSSSPRENELQQKKQE